MNPTAVLLVSCPDQKGLVAKIANFIYANGGNVIHADQHTDAAAGLFLMRVEWELEGFNLPQKVIAPAFQAIAQPLGATWQLHFSNTLPRMAIWVGKQDHCLYDLLWRYKAKELAVKIPLILSNHPDLGEVATQFGIDYQYLPITKENKLDQELKQLALLQEYEVDVVVLAKYMQILSQDFINKFSKPIINIITLFYLLLSGQVLTNRRMIEG